MALTIRTKSELSFAGDAGPECRRTRDPAVECDDGGVIVKSLGKHSPTEQTAPNPKVLGTFSQH